MDGRYLEDGDRLHAYIGVGMAERLGVRTGSRMVLTAQAASGDIEGQLVRVVGIYRTGVEALDQSLVHIPLGTARSWLGVEGATTVAVLLTTRRSRTRWWKVCGAGWIRPAPRWWDGP